MDKGSYASVTSQRVLVWMTIVLGVLFAISYIGLMRFFPPPPADLPAEEVVALYSAHNIRFRIGVILGLISGGFLLPVTVVISVQMRGSKRACRSGRLCRRCPARWARCSSGSRC